jgi:hypothetical protein
MFWSWLSIIVVLIGGEFNAETEHQTVRDTTTGGRSPWASAAQLWPIAWERTGLIAANSREPDRVDEQ